MKNHDISDLYVIVLKYRVSLKQFYRAYNGETHLIFIPPTLTSRIAKILFSNATMINIKG